MAGRTTSASRRRAAPTRRTPAASSWREPWPRSRRSTRAKGGFGASFPGPFELLGKLIVGFWTGLAHLLGWLVRAAGRQAVSARDLHPRHQRDGAELVAFAVALLLTV